MVKPLFDGMVGRAGQSYVTFQNTEYPLLFNLKEPLLLVNSKNSPGVQLADVIASCAALCFSKRNRKKLGETERSWLRHLAPRITQAVWPEPRRFAKNRKDGIVGTFILTELVRRSVEKRDLVRGLPRSLGLMRFERELARRRKHR